jgi:dipeptidyl aminopeptidase/acylaminoacyl peptidase
MMVAIFLSSFFAGAPQANKNNEPLVSATNPTYLSCTFWTGKIWSKPAARSARTPVVQSPGGLLAYGEVKVEVQNDDCENTTTLYVAAAEGKEFRSVYKKDGGGNGIRIIGWSPDGDHLLVEVTSWAYETDTGFEYTPVIYDAATSKAQENSALEKALIDQVGKDCSFEHNLTQWKTNAQVLVRVSPYRDVDGSDEYSCVKQPKLLLYDLQTSTLTPFSPHPSKSN